MEYTGAKNYSSNRKDHDKLVALAMAKYLEKNRKKQKTEDESDSENGLDQFIFEKLDIGEDSNWEWLHGRKEQIIRPKFCEMGTIVQ